MSAKLQAIDGKDYIGGELTLVFSPGQSAMGNNMQCISLAIIDDHALEKDEWLSISLSPSLEFASVVRISLAKRDVLVLINEVPSTDSKYSAQVS